jgi:hypothetical protein
MPPDVPSGRSAGAQPVRASVPAGGRAVGARRLWRLARHVRALFQRGDAFSDPRGPPCGGSIPASSGRAWHAFAARGGEVDQLTSNWASLFLRRVLPLTCATVVAFREAGLGASAHPSRLPHRPSRQSRTHQRLSPLPQAVARSCSFRPVAAPAARDPALVCQAFGVLAGTSRRGCARLGVIRGSAENVHGSGDDEDHHGVRDQRLDGHEALGPPSQRHRVRRADRDRVGERHVEIVTESWAPV